MRACRRVPAVDPYTTRSSVARRLALGGITSASGLTASSLAGNNAITLDGHGFETGDAVMVRAIQGGTLSTPLVAGVTYYARRRSNSEFELALTVSGAAIDLTTDSYELVVIREPDFDYWIGFYSRWADSSLPGHLVPMGRITPVPVLVEGLVADLVAKRMFNVGGAESATLKDMEIASVAQLARFASGMPVRDANATAPANLAVTSSLAGAADPRGWYGADGSGRIL